MSTERNRPEEALTSSEQELRLLVDAISTLVWRAAPDGNFEYVNKRMLKYLGAPLSEVIGWVDAQSPSRRRGVQGNELAPKSRIGKPSRCCMQNSRCGRSISMVRGPRRTIASRRWHGAELVRRPDRYR